MLLWFPSVAVVTDRMGEFKEFLKASLRIPAQLLIPPVCAGCRRLVRQPGTLCPTCWSRVRFIERPWCPVMGTPFAHDPGENMLSAEAIANPPPFGRLRSAVAYGGVAGRMVQGLKYRDRTDLAPWMARWMARAGAELVESAQIVVPVPLHRVRFLLRSFNQSAELGRAVASLAGLPFEPGAVVRSRATRQQVGLGTKAREMNVRGAFRVPETADIIVRGRNVLLVDDVYTSGATVGAVTRAILRAGARSVDVLTFARVLHGDFQQEDAEPI